jgi:putative ABC transport system permease protein
MNLPRHARRAGGVKGRALLLFRLARQDIRHHFAQALLLVVAIAVATATLTMAFALNGVNANPYQQTKAATKGPDVVAQSSPSTNVTSPADIAALVALNHARGVAATAAPIRWLPPSCTAGASLPWWPSKDVRLAWLRSTSPK